MMRRHLVFAVVALASRASAQDHAAHNTFIPIPPPQAQVQATPDDALAAARATSRPVSAVPRVQAATVPEMRVPAAPRVRSAVVPALPRVPAQPRVSAAAEADRAAAPAPRPPVAPPLQAPLSVLPRAQGAPVLAPPAARGARRGVPRVARAYRPAYLELLKLGDRRREAGDTRGAAEAYAAVLQILPDNPAAMLALRALGE